MVEVQAPDVGARAEKIRKDRIRQIAIDRGAAEAEDCVSAAIVVDAGMGGISLRRLSPLFISITEGFSSWDEMASFRFDQFVRQLADSLAENGGFICEP